MPNTDQVNWQPISQMPLIASMIDSVPERHARAPRDA